MKKNSFQETSCSMFSLFSRNDVASPSTESESEELAGCEEDDKKPVFKIISVPQTLPVSIEWKYEELEKDFVEIDRVVPDWRCFTSQETSVGLIQLSNAVAIVDVQMCRKFYGFSDIQLEDRLALLRGGWRELNYLYFAMHTCVNGDCWELSDSRSEVQPIDLIHLKVKCGASVHSKFTKFVKAIPIKWRTDKKLMLLLHPLLLYNPDRPDVQRKDQVWKFQQFYYNLLRSYINKLYPKGQKAQLVFLAMIEILAKVRFLSADLNEIIKALHKEADIKKHAPLICDFFPNDNRA